MKNLFILISLLAFYQANSTSLDTVPVFDSMKRIEHDELFKIVEKEAIYPGGAAAWMNYLQENINGDVPSLLGAKPGVYKVVVQFIVDTEGKVIDAKGLTKYGYGMEKEVMRVIKKSITWMPAIQNGREVRAYKKQEITFTVYGEEKAKKWKKIFF